MAEYDGFSEAWKDPVARKYVYIFFVLAVWGLISDALFEPPGTTQSECHKLKNHSKVNIIRRKFINKLQIILSFTFAKFQFIFCSRSTCVCDQGFCLQQDHHINATMECKGGFCFQEGDYCSCGGGMCYQQCYECSCHGGMCGQNCTISTCKGGGGRKFLLKSHQNS